LFTIAVNGNLQRGQIGDDLSGVAVLLSVNVGMAFAVIVGEADDAWGRHGAGAPLIGWGEKSILGRSRFAQEHQL